MTFSGLPVHALIVHLAVILVPLAALGLIATGWRPCWRQQYGPALALIAVAGAVAAFLAAQSGESLQHAIRTAARSSGVRADFGDHPDDGSRAEIVAGVLAVVAVGLWALERWQARLPLRPWMPWAAYAVVTLVSLTAVLTMVSAGHSGATLVWKDLGTFIGRR